MAGTTSMTGPAAGMRFLGASGHLLFLRPVSGPFPVHVVSVCHLCHYCATRGQKLERYGAVDPRLVRARPPELCRWKQGACTNCSSSYASSPALVIFCLCLLGAAILVGVTWQLGF